VGANDKYERHTQREGWEVGKFAKRDRRNKRRLRTTTQKEDQAEVRASHSEQAVDADLPRRCPGPAFCDEIECDYCGRL